jgi:hypothetical protein
VPLDRTVEGAPKPVNPSAPKGHPAIIAGAILKKSEKDGYE